MERVQFFDAVKQHDMPLVRQMLAQNPQLVNSRDDDTYTALIYACYAGDFNMMSLLLNKLSEKSLWRRKQPSDCYAHASL
jgi:ankyrin repeat protein